MAQTFPTSAEVIYNTLAGDATFMSFVGTYTFADGTVLPSITVKSPGEDTKGLSSISGLEVVVIDIGDVTTQSYVSNDSPDSVFTFNVFLVAWEPSNGQAITNAVGQMVKRFLGLESIDTVAASDGIGALVQTKVMIKSNMPILP